MTTSTGPMVKKLVLLAILLTAVGIGYMEFSDSLTLEKLAAREAELKELQQARPLLVYGLAFLIYVAVTGLSLPGATVLTLACGWFFGFAPAFILVSFASTAGATIAFLVSRFLLRDFIQHRFGDRLATFHRSLEREGAFYLFMLRLIPAFPFFVINVVMGLTPLKTRTYWWVSQVGMLPGTAVYVYAGASVPSLSKLAQQGVQGILSTQLLIAFSLLGAMPLVLRKLVSWLRPTGEQLADSENDDSPELPVA